MSEATSRNIDPDRIDGTGYPRAFLVEAGAPSPVVLGAGPARDVFRVEARLMGSAGHQKEMLVTEGTGGRKWRLVSDEGPALKGTDLAPYPLAFFNAGLVADFFNRAIGAARQRGTTLPIEALRLTNRYQFTGSFFRGTGQGSAQPADLALRTTVGRDRAEIDAIVAHALHASPAHVAMREVLANTFGLSVNGQQIPVTRVKASTNAREAEPFAPGTAPLSPLTGWHEREELIGRFDPGPDAPPPRVASAEGTVAIELAGTGALDAGSKDALIATMVEARFPGSRYHFLSDENPGPEAIAPSGLAYLCAGIAFCYMTQFARYIEHRKLKVDSLKLVQTIPFRLDETAGCEGLQGGIEPVDTQVFMQSHESDETMQHLLEIAENTCYLHAALRSALPASVTVAIAER